MSATDLHPEHLIDLTLQQETSPEQEAQLREHIVDCETCRAELALAGALASPTTALLSTNDTAALDTAAIEASLQRLIADHTLQPDVVRPLPVPSSGSLLSRLGAGGALAAGGVVLALLLWAPATPAPPIIQNLGPAQRPVAQPAPAPTVAARPAEEAQANTGSAQSDALTRPSPETVAAPPAQKALTLSAAELFERATVARRSGDSAGAIQLYQQLQQSYPASSEALVSRLALGRMLLRSSPSRALSQFESYLQSGGSLQPEALVGKARALSALGRHAEERATWQKVVEVAPDSLYADQARRHLAPSRLDPLSPSPTPPRHQPGALGVARSCRGASASLARELSER